MAAQGDHQLAFSALVIDGQAAAHHQQQQLQQNPEKLPKQSGEPITARAKLREAAGTGADIEAGASQLFLTHAHTPFLLLGWASSDECYHCGAMPMQCRLLSGEEGRGARERPVDLRGEADGLAGWGCRVGVASGCLPGGACAVGLK